MRHPLRVQTPGQRYGVVHAARPEQAGVVLACSMRPLAIVATKKGVTCRRCLQMIGKSR